MGSDKLEFAAVAKLFESARVFPAVLLAGYEGQSGGAWEPWETVAPYSTYAAVEEAGRLLQRSPGITLAREAIPEETIMRIPPQDIAARSLAQIINDSLNRRHTSEAFISPRGGRYSICDLNERFFASTLNFVATEESYLDNGVGIGSHYDGYQIVTGQEGRPILLRKRRGQQCALSLTPIAINGVVYPRGSVMRYDLNRDWCTTTGRYIDEPLRNAQQDIVSATEVGRISFLRLSAFALDVSERHIFPLQPGDFPALHAYERYMLQLDFSDIYAIMQDAIGRQTGQSVKEMTSRS